MLRNSTNIPDQLIAIAMAHGMPPGITKGISSVIVKNKRHGRVHGRWGWFYPEDRSVVIIVPRVISRTHSFTRPFSRKKMTISSRAEFLIAVMAHELRHAWQADNWNTPASKWKLERTKLGKYAREVDAELWEMKALDKWREQFAAVASGF